MLILTWIRKLYKALSADSSPSAIAIAMALGLLAGCMPLGAGLSVLLVLTILIFRVQVSTALLFWGVGGLIRIAAAPLLARIGETLLEAEPLKPFWTWLLNLPFIAWLNLDVYVVLGGAVFGALLGAALFVPMRIIIISYRKHAQEKLQKSKFFRWLMRLWIVKLLRFVFVGGK